MLANFWHQFGNSFYVGLMVMFLALLIGSLASFTVGRMPGYAMAGCSATPR